MKQKRSITSIINIILVTLIFIITNYFAIKKIVANQFIGIVIIIIMLAIFPIIFYIMAQTFKLQNNNIYETKNENELVTKQSFSVSFNLNFKNIIKQTVQYKLIVSTIIFYTTLLFLTIFLSIFYQKYYLLLILAIVILPLMLLIFYLKYIINSLEEIHQSFEKININDDGFFYSNNNSSVRFYQFNLITKITKYKQYYIINGDTIFDTIIINSEIINNSTILSSQKIFNN